jgi:plastocyanin domain-containing protein
MRLALLAFLALVAACPPAGDEAAPAPSRSAAPAEAGGRVEIKVTDSGFEPREVKVKRGRPVTLVFTRVTDHTCIKAVDIPDEGVKGFELPLDRAVSLTLTPKKAGVEAFHCTAMGMGNGKIIVSD